jgi:tRNA threonylcarbamoyladenosine biosynthesis protein TsaB
LKILALETSSPKQSVATLADGVLVQEKIDECGRKHSLQLFSNIAHVLTLSGWNFAELDGVAFSGGPGSLTGVRIGELAAIGLALPRNLPVVKIASLKALALKAVKSNTAQVVATIVDAHIHQVYFGLFSLAKDGQITTEIEPTVFSPEEALATLPPNSLVLGDGVLRYPSVFQSIQNRSLGSEFTFPQAHQVGKLAHEEFSSGRGFTPMPENYPLLEPTYYRAAVNTVTPR